MPWHGWQWRRTCSVDPGAGTEKLATGVAGFPEGRRSDARHAGVRFPARSGDGRVGSVSAYAGAAAGAWRRSRQLSNPVKGRDNGWQDARWLSAWPDRPGAAVAHRRRAHPPFEEPVGRQVSRSHIAVGLAQLPWTVQREPLY